MATKKAADLDQLLRLHGWTVDERRRELGVFLAREADLIAAAEALVREMISEQAIAAADPANAGSAFAPFAEYHKIRRELVAAQLAEVRAEIEAARDRLADAYRELKIFEEVQKARVVIEDKEEARLEQFEQDEIALNQHRRK